MHTGQGNVSGREAANIQHARLAIKRKYSNAAYKDYDRAEVGPDLMGFFLWERIERLSLFFIELCLRLSLYVRHNAIGLLGDARRHGRGGRFRCVLCDRGALATTATA